MRLGRFAGPMVGRAYRSPGPTRYCHVEGETPGGGKAKAQETRWKTRWAARKLGDAEARREGRMDERAEMKEQAPEGKVSHRERVESG